MKLFSTFLALVLCLFSGECSSADRPNILLIVSEDNGPELGCYGEPSVRTPVLDRLAEEGVRFENAFVPQAGCSQSRAALLTGLYPHQNGQIGLATWKFRMYREDMPNLVRSLKRAGYRTGLIGKLHINPKSAFPFDEHHISTSNFSRKNLGGYARHAEEFIAAGEQPFFLSVNYPDAHRPFTNRVKGLPKELLTGEDVKPMAYFGIDTPELREQTASYYNCISRLDSLISDLLDALQRSGKAENTLVVYLGDHGADLLRGKRTSYEGGFRIPLIVRWPGQIEPKQVRNELVSTLDLMPTFLAATKAEAVDGLPGRSLIPLLKNEPTDWREFLFTEYHLHSAHNFFPQRSARNANYKLIQNLQPGQVNPGYDFTLNRFFADLPKAISEAPEPVRSAYRLMRAPPEFELYDLKSDPFEFRNLAADPGHGEALAKLKEQLAAWRKRTRDPLLSRKNLKRLKTEVEACFVDGKPSKDHLNLTYPDYFFAKERKPGVGTGRASSRDDSVTKANVLFIAIDDLRPALGCFGDKAAVSPHIDQLATRGTTFTRAYCQLAVCSPSRLSLLTGRRPDAIQVWDLKTHFRKAIPDAVTLPQLFKNSGYHTRSIGKIFHGSGEPSKDSPSWSVDPLFDTTRTADVRYALPKNLKGEGLKRSSTESAEVNDGVYLDGMVCSAAEKAISNLAAAEKPFFLAVGFRKPHLPFCAPQKYWDLYEREQIPLPEFARHPQDAPELAVRSWKELEGYTDIPVGERLNSDQIKRLRHGYYACVSYVDALVGRLVDSLKQARIEDETVIVLWGDHGYHLGDHGTWTKHTNYEQANRIPIVISAPGVTKPGSSSKALIETVDLFPTIAELAGLPEPTGPQPIDGDSFASILKGSPVTTIGEYAYHSYPKGNRLGRAIRTSRYRLVEWKPWGKPSSKAEYELYDYETDPLEKQNLASEKPDVVKKLSAILVRQPKPLTRRTTR